MSLTIHAKERLASPPAAVLLDLDGTLYPYGPAHAAGLEGAALAAANLLGLEAPDFRARYDASRAEIQAALGGTASSHSRLLYFQRLVEGLGRGPAPGASLALEEAYWSRYLAAARLFPGSKEFLDDLCRAGIPSALVTDLTAATQLRKLVALGLEQSFQAIVTSEEAGRDKPHPAIFALAMEKLRPPPGPVWMIGDDPRADIEGAAHALGAVTFQRLDPGITPSPKADVLFDDFAEPRALLASLAPDWSMGAVGSAVRFVEE